MTDYFQLRTSTRNSSLTLAVVSDAVAMDHLPVPIELFPPPGGRRDREQATAPLPGTAWRRFQAALDAAQVWDWERSFFRCLVLGGLRWRIDAQRGMRTVTCEGGLPPHAPDEMRSILGTLRDIVPSDLMQRQLSCLIDDFGREFG